MPKTKKGAKVMKAMRKTYGSKEKAEQVFHASKNAGKIKGVDRGGSKRGSRKRQKR